MVVRRGSAIFASLLFIIGINAAPAAAQTWSITPWLGYSFPGGDVGEFTDGDATLTASQGSGFAFGAMLGYDGTGKVGFDFGLGYLSSDVEAEFCVDGAGCDSVDESGSVLSLNARARYAFSTSETRTIYGAAGLAYLMRGGDAWDEVALGDEVDGKDDFGVSLALGMRHAIGERMSIVVELEDVLFSGELDADFGTGVESNSNINNHFTLKGGVRIPFGG